MPQGFETKKVMYRMFHGNSIYMVFTHKLVVLEIE